MTRKELSEIYKTSMNLRRHQYSRLNPAEIAASVAGAILWTLASKKIIEFGVPEVYIALIVTIGFAAGFWFMLAMEIFKCIKDLRKRKKRRRKR